MSTPLRIENAIMNNALKLMILVTFPVSLLTNSISFVDFVLYILAIIFALTLFSRFSFSGNWGKYMVFLYVWISVILMPSFHLVRHLDPEYSNYYANALDYDRLLSFGIHLFFLISVSSVFLGVFLKKQKSRSSSFKPNLIKKRYVTILFIFTYILTIFSYIVGISRMGSEAVQLPYHLSGIVNLYRLSLFPLLFAIVIENYILNRKKVANDLYVAYFIWVILEVFTWMSKGIIIELLLPISLVLILYYRPPIKKILRIAAPIFFLFVLLYPIIGIMRHMDSGSLSELVSNVHAAKVEADSNTESQSVLLTILNRTFMTGFQYGVDYGYLDHTQLFDFTRLPMLFIYRGAQGYQTHYIDGFADDAVNSSGTTGIMDPLLHGGYGLCYIVVFVLILVASYVDKYYCKKQYSIYVIMLLVLWSLCGSNISMLYDPTGIQFLFVFLIGVIISYRVNFRKSSQQICII